jgi:hypothetical protein
MAPPTTSDYRLSPALAARLVGLLLVVLLAVLGLVSVFGTGFALTRRAYVVRLGEEGYRVRMIRGAGVTEARWKDVEDAVTTSPRGIDCVVLRLKDRRTTTIPVSALAADREAFVRDLRDHLQKGQGLRPL